MAKKLKVPKKAAKKAAKPAPKKAPKARTPLEQPTLPGAEGVRSDELDGICEALGRIRDQKNKLIAQEREEMLDALPAMQAAKVLQYRHAGIELVRKVGAEKLAVRVVTDTGDASAAEVLPVAAPAE